MESLFLACFLFGALFTIVSVILGFVGSAMHGVDGAHLGHVSDGGHAGEVGHGSHDGGHHGGDRGSLPILNLSTLLAFLTWFGAAGYVLTRFGSWPPLVTLPVAVLAGAGGGMLVSFFLRTVLAGERVMDPSDYRLEGTTARVTVSIPAQGVGEIIFTQAGARRSATARSLSGHPIPRDTEVVVIDHERGIASVQPWDEFVGRVAPDSLEQGR